ncbi:uncharacterized protein LOC133862979 isoform X2 [Alnus glutinosa]|uniref:uncharacterized protein LOC133862979 isoform X2 n=1 Tax=Alnus glutinosa TaxID=3517 RepID=UPI002D782843|nr:uncharacterized protein LOC133862979 isoform X2 [Alnus glutinosa]
MQKARNHWHCFRPSFKRACGLNELFHQYAGSFVVVDISGKEKALESGSKVACIVSQVLFYEQVRAIQKSPEWPEIFKSTNVDDSNGSLHGQTSQQEEELGSSDDDEGLPPIEANTNRIKPFDEFQPDAESDSSSDIDS